ncbi:tumor necrosis factor receptor superfamily member 6B-like [Genypterus blacodes]|uniref:tumor necrosis factor receptor superfamily member 6B-like n=1 Tax=Genypterus blacodes TaxID=154954 RepID=UPI003F757229
MFHLLLSLLPAVLLSPLAAGDALASPRTFRHTDRDTGTPLLCNSCPAGTFLSARCTVARQSVCTPCPSGSFTELSNHISKCLRCGTCGHNQVVKVACTALSDCECACRDGYYLYKKYGMCLSHSACQSGHGLLSRGTAEEDTVCHVCPSGSYSDVSSAVHNCTLHSRCDAAGQQLVLKGSTWHDSICTTCDELKSRDGADYLKEILPSFFVHQNMPCKRLRRLLPKLPSGVGKRSRGNMEGQSQAELQAELNTWLSSASAPQLRQLPGLLTKIRADYAGERVENKLQQIDSQLSKLCVEVVEQVEVVE